MITKTNKVLSALLLSVLFSISILIVVETTASYYGFNPIIEDFKRNTELQLTKLKKAEMAMKESTITLTTPNISVRFYANQLQPKINTDYLAYLIDDLEKPEKIRQRLDIYLNNIKPSSAVEVSFNKEGLDDIILLLKEKNEIPPVSAKFQYENNRVTVFEIEKYGTGIDTRQLWQDIERAFSEISNQRKRKDVEIAVKLVPIRPETTLADLNSFNIKELIASGESDFSGSIPARVHNIITASEKLNGVLIPQGSMFSFNSEIGDISVSEGYKQSYIIKDGKTVLGDGGGVCQVSTTVFRAALNAGLPIIERQAHSYRVSYYENDSKPGLDATVFSPYVDLKFKNDTSGAILIQTKVDTSNNKLYVYLYGQKDNRVVKLSDIRVWDIKPPPEPLFIEDETLPLGTKKQIDFSAYGAKSSFDYIVYKDNKVIYSKTFVSIYKPWQAVYLVNN
ncbi:MAG: hypothetical protein KatS3mg090_0882 [Patescibacteria group bacterium]|nr:MAG: hypothetical protein KatS3mg090_0882 [Patescibacteria group bacterium]